MARRNPWLFVSSVLEALLTLAAVYAVMRLFDVRPVTAAAAGVLAIATSPGVVVTLVKDLRAQGQVTERVILFTALNTAYAVVGLALIVGWLHFESARAPIMIAPPLYLIIGSLALAALLAAAMILILRLFGRRPTFQLAITVSFVLLTVAAASALELSVPLTLLLTGMLGRIFDRDRHFVSLRFGQTAMLFVVLLFALAGAGLEFPRVARRAADGARLHRRALPRQAGADHAAGPAEQPGGAQGVARATRAHADVRARAADAARPCPAGALLGAGHRRQHLSRRGHPRLRRTARAAVRAGPRRRDRGGREMSDMQFGPSKALTFGIELELQILNRRDCDLTRGAKTCCA